jgi:peptidoglycan/LPS O-acetylase OafA/YrhL
MALVLIVAGLMLVWLAVEFGFFGLSAAAIGGLPVRALFLLLGVLTLIWLWQHRAKWH